MSLRDSCGAGSGSFRSRRSPSPSASGRRSVDTYRSSDGASEFDDTASIASSAHFGEFGDTGAAPDRVADMLAEEVLLANSSPGAAGRLTHRGRSVSIDLPLIDMNPLIREAADLVDSLPLTLNFDMEAGCGRKAPRPEVSVRYGDTQQTRRTLRISSSTRQNPDFTVGLQLVQAVQKYLDRSWQERGESFWSDMCAFVDQRLLNAGDNCMMCDTELTFPGFKPTICEAPLCAYQLDSLGIGSSLDAFVKTPKVADFLLLTSAAAAQAAISNRPGCLPTTPSMADGASMPKATFAQMMRTLPKVADIAAWVSTTEYTPQAECIDTEAKRLLRWILSSNRAHLIELQGDACIEGISCTEQFKIHTSTRSHAKAFEALKAAHGSFYAFHGSPLHNWHNILRNNLQNLSGTAMMSSGAAYGKGIYLADIAGTSLGYTGVGTNGGVGWMGSVLGPEPKVLALCEVANAPTLIRGRQTGIIVAPNPSCVTLRYLFVFSQGFADCKNVQANALRLQRYRNETTIASMEPISALPPERLLVTSDNYAWDIDEVVAMVTAKHGLFINSYTQQSFAPADVRAILDHKSGGGAELRQLEKDNAALRQMVTSSTLDYLRKTGRVCKNDQSLEFGPSNKALAELRAFIDSLPEKERAALRLAPFSATDSHTNEDLRDTVDNALSLALSASACIHRFGDFLSQLRR